MSVHAKKIIATCLLFSIPVAASGQLRQESDDKPFGHRVAQLLTGPEKSVPGVLPAPKAGVSPVKSGNGEAFNDMILQLPNESSQRIGDSSGHVLTPSNSQHDGTFSSTATPDQFPIMETPAHGGSSLLDGKSSSQSASEIFESTIPQPMNTDRLEAFAAPPIGTPTFPAQMGPPSPAPVNGRDIESFESGFGAAPPLHTQRDMFGVDKWLPNSSETTASSPGLFGSFLHRCGQWACGEGCGDRCPRIYGSAEYLGWWLRGQQLPALVTSSTPGTMIDRAGVIGHPSTSVLFGGGREDANSNSGGRFMLGLNLDCRGCNRLEANYLFLNNDDADYVRSSPDDGSIFGRPFYNVYTNYPDAELVAYPDVVEGSVRVNTSTDFDGYGITFRHNMMCCNPCRCGTTGGGPCRSCCDPCCGDGCSDIGNLIRSICTGNCSSLCQGWQLRSFDLLVGWQHYNLNESLGIQENLTSIDTDSGVPVGTTFDIADSFRTKNDFDGVNVGLGWEWGRCKWGVNLAANLAVGCNQQRGIVEGSTAIRVPGDDPLYYDGGLLALGSNLGVFERDKCTVIPQVGANMYYCIRPGARLTFGYTMIYFDDVLRPGGLIDPAIDPRQLPPEIPPFVDRPTRVATLDNFWAQGINFGIEVCF